MTNQTTNERTLVTFERDASNTCMRVLLATDEAVYLRLPEFLQRPAGDNCLCGNCGGKAMWDTLAVPTKPGGPNARNDWSYTVHLPDGAVAGVKDYWRKRGKLAA